MVGQKHSKRASVSAAVKSSGSPTTPLPKIDEQKTTTERGRDAVETLDVIQTKARDDSLAQCEKEEDIPENSPIDLARELTDFMESVKDADNDVTQSINLVNSHSSTKAEEDADNDVAQSIYLVNNHSIKAEEDAGNCPILLREDQQE